MNKPSFAATAVIAVLATGFVFASPLQAQSVPIPGISPSDGASKLNLGGKPDLGGVTQMRQMMPGDTKAMDNELDALIVKMNQATGSDKIIAMAAVITKMAQQRKIMEQQMAIMQAAMMSGMTGKMGNGLKINPFANQPAKLTLPTSLIPM